MLNTIAKTVTWLLAIYFIASGLLVVADIDAKLARIGLAATNEDGKVAFILIYCSLMVGIGLAMPLVWFIAKSFRPSLALAGSVIACFVVFRVVGATMLGEVSPTQRSFILVELIEVAVIGGVLWRTRTAEKAAAV